jgi:hypothetical protein
MGQQARSEMRRAVRTGRPPRLLAEEVDTRILNAARLVFLERSILACAAAICTSASSSAAR